MINPKKAELLIKEMGNDKGRDDEVEAVQSSPTDDLGKKIIDAIYEISSSDIPVRDAIKIFIAFEHGADTEHEVSRVTGIDIKICKIVLDIFHKFQLLNKGILDVQY